MRPTTVSRNISVRSHPLYQARQSTIESNLVVLKDKKEIVFLDQKALIAITKPGELRAVETLVPILLLKLKSGAKPNEEITDEKFDTVKDYPAAIALAKIGIPSIWGLLDGIATAEHDDENYREMAYKTMTTILPDVAIPGFVNEALKKHSDEIAQLRLYKMYPLMGLSIEGTPLVPQMRLWESRKKNSRPLQDSSGRLISNWQFTRVCSIPNDFC